MSPNFTNMACGQQCKRIFKVFFKHRFRSKRNGVIEIDISGEERELLKNLIAQLRELVLSTSSEGQLDPSIRRLFPAAHAENQELEREYQKTMRDQLLEKRLSNLDTVELSLFDKELEPETLSAWITIINDLRLVLGTHLDVSEEEELSLADPNSPDHQQRAIYHYLSHLLGELVDVASI